MIPPGCAYRLPLPFPFPFEEPYQLPSLPAPYGPSPSRVAGANWPGTAGFTVGISEGGGLDSLHYFANKGKIRENLLIPRSLDNPQISPTKSFFCTYISGVINEIMKYGSLYITSFNNQRTLVRRLAMFFANLLFLLEVPLVTSIGTMSIQYRKKLVYMGKSSVSQLVLLGFTTMSS